MALRVAPKESDLTSSVETERPNLYEAGSRIQQVEKDKKRSLDLGGLKLIEVPRELLDLKYLRKLYMARNSLLEIPDEFCSALPKVQWLDLRSNLLSRIPSTIKMMKSLQILLLDDNRLKMLPFELGVHVRNNPIEFPCQKILNRGTKGVLNFLRDCYISREHAASARGAKMSSQPVSLHVESGVISGDDIVRENSDEKKIEEFSVPTTPVKPEVAERPISGDGTIRRSQSWCGLSSRGDASPSRIEVDESKLKSEEELDSALQFSKLVEILERHKDEPSTEEGATADTRQIRSCPWLSARSKMYRQVEKNYFYKRRNPTHPYGENSFGRLPKQSARHEALLPEVPAQPTLEKIRAIYRQEKQKKERQRAMALQQTMLQNLRDADKIRKWRQNYVRMQKDQIAEFLGKTQKEIREEANQRILSGPLDVTRDDLKVLGSNELNNIRQRSIQSARRPSNLDPETVLQLELAGMERDSRLRDQVQRHMKDVAKRFQVPLPQTHEALKIELLTAKRDLDEAINLHKRVKQRLETMQHFHGSNRRDLW